MNQPASEYPNLICLGRNRRLVLGSGSPRRVRLLKELGLNFRQDIPAIDETFRPGEDPLSFAVRLAEDKARAVAARAERDEIVIGGDTVVVLDGTILDKPTSPENAVTTLQTLSGREHIVGTALAISIGNGKVWWGLERTAVRFNKVTTEQIQNYVASGEPMDKAGAYGIQGMGAFLVDTLRGNLDNVIGLPRSLLDRLAGDVLHWLNIDCD